MIDLSDMPSREIFPGFHGRLIHTQRATLVYWTIEPNSPLPAHHHPHEQIVNVLEGSFELTIDEETEIVPAGCVAVIPPGAPHSGRALTRCRILDVFCPAREDYR
jgi:quercetin dioxygenase-like cupin family protein